MIVVAIIGVLAAIAIPAYQNYSKRFSETACLAETKGLASQQFVKLNDPEGSTSMIAAAGACSALSYTAATGSGASAAPAKMTGTIKNPQDITKGKAVCTLGDIITCKVAAS